MPATMPTQPEDSTPRAEGKAAIAPIAAAAQQGDAAAFAKLVERFQDMAVGTAFARLRDAETARDAAQEAFTEAFLRLSQLREPAAFPGWLRRIVLKQCDRATRRRVHPTASLEQVAEPPSSRTLPTAAFEADEAHTHLRRAIEALPEHERIVVALYYIAGDSQDDIASYLEIAPGTVRKRLHSARRQLKRRSLEMTTTPASLRPSRDRQFSEEIQLFLAVRSGDLASARALLDMNPALANAEETYETSEAIEEGLPIPTRGTPLIRAAECGDVAMIDLLLDHGADPNRDCGCAGRESALWAALVAHRGEAVRRLLERGADVGAGAFWDKTPLHVAAIRGFDDLVPLLLAHGAEPERRCAAGRTAAEWAREKGFDEIARRLDEAADGRPAGTEAASGAASTAEKSTTGPAETRPGRPAGGSAADRTPARELPPRPGNEPPALPPGATGIKALDLFAPFEPGARIRLHGRAGLGQIVMVSECVHNLVRSEDARHVWATFGASPWQARDADAGLAELGIEGLVHTVRAEPGGPERARHEVAQRAMRAAENLRRNGARHVVLTIFEEDGFAADVEAVLPRAGRDAHGAITAIVVDPLDGVARTQLPELAVNFDARVALDPALAAIAHYPAIHPLWSCSRSVSKEHGDIAETARGLLGRLRELDPKLTARPLDDIEASQRSEVERARQLQAFLTQPFNTVEPFHYRTGAHVSPAETQRGVVEIVDGRFAGVDPGHFYMHGGIDEVREAISRA